PEGRIAEDPLLERRGVDGSRRRRLQSRRGGVRRVAAHEQEDAEQAGAGDEHGVHRDVLGGSGSVGHQLWLLWPPPPGDVAVGGGGVAHVPFFTRSGKVRLGSCADWSLPPKSCVGCSRSNVKVWPVLRAKTSSATISTMKLSATLPMPVTCREEPLPVVSAPGLSSSCAADELERRGGDVDDLVVDELRAGVDVDLVAGADVRRSSAS